MTDFPTAAVAYRAPVPADHPPLRAMARRSFAETFGHLYEREPFASFLESTYGPGGAMDHDLRNPEIEWDVAFDGPRPIGYSKLTPLRAPAPAPVPGALELQQLYVLAEWHGTGVAAHLMEHALDRATAVGAPELYLTVFDHNERAKRFYARYGFAEVGHCTFTLGDRVDDDRVWLRRM